MASLRKKGKSGHYYAVFYDAALTPKEKWVPLKTTLKSAAVVQFHELQRRFADPYDAFDPWVPKQAPRNVTVAEAIDLFLQSRAHLRPRTVEIYTGLLGRMSRTLSPGLRLRDLRAHHLQAWVTAFDIKTASQRKRFTHLRAFLKWALKEDLLDVNPLDALRQPRAERKEPVFLSASNLERLLAIDYHAEHSRNAAGQAPDVGWFRDLLRVAVATGLRRGELLGLRWFDVDLEHRFVIVRESKSGHQRRVPLVGPALEVLRRLQEGRPDALDGPVFRDRRGLPIKPARVSKVFKRMVRLARLDDRLRFHDTRHTCGSWLAMKGVPLRVIQVILGHQSITTTEIYSHLLPETITAAMDATFGNQ